MVSIFNEMNLIIFLKKIRRAYLYVMRSFVDKADLGLCGKNSFIENPVWFENPRNIFLEENAKIRHHVSIINSPQEKVYIKKYTVLAAHVTLITNSHRSTVGIPQFLLGVSHIHDKSEDLVIGEDVWVGAGAFILPGAQLGRGCIVAAGAIVTKPVPPYALVAGIPAKIIAVKFSKEGILKHEQVLYKEEERLSSEYLDGLFANYFTNKSVFGVECVLTESELDLLNQLKKDSRFVEPY